MTTIEAAKSTEATKSTVEAVDLAESLPESRREQRLMESCYRKGYAQGARDATKAADQGVPLNKVFDWIFRELADWRYADCKKQVLPPKPPRQLSVTI